MNLLNFKIVKNFTRFTLFCVFFFAQVTVRAWQVDFSRREKQLESMRVPASIVDESGKKEELQEPFFQVIDATQEIVILNTDKGFVPQTVHLKKGYNYKISVVNVNEKEKNSSFVMDAFSEQHATYFGQLKTFTISPKAEGVFSFQCPETSIQGKIVVIPEEGRKPASKY